MSPDRDPDWFEDDPDPTSDARTTTATTTTPAARSPQTSAPTMARGIAADSDPLRDALLARAAALPVDVLRRLVEAGEHEARQQRQRASLRHHPMPGDRPPTPQHGRQPRIIAMPNSPHG